MNCSNCGKEIPEGKKFCGYCGTKVQEAPPAQPVQPEQPPARSKKAQPTPKWLLWAVPLAVVAVGLVLAFTLGWLPLQKPAQEEARLPAQPVVDEGGGDVPANNEAQEPEQPDGGEPTGSLGTAGNPLIWGLVPQGDEGEVMAGFETIINVLFEVEGLVVEAYIAEDDAEMINLLASEPPGMHIASLPTFTYLLASERGVAQAELVGVRFGSPYYQGQIITRIGSGITDVGDLAGKTFCRPDPLSTSGWIVPSVTMLSLGIDPENDLGAIRDSGSHEDVVIDVYNGVCDAGSTYVDARIAVEGVYTDVWNVVLVINESEQIPNEGVQYQPSVPRGLRDRINDVLLNMTNFEGGVDALESVFSWSDIMEKGDDFYNPFPRCAD